MTELPTLINAARVHQPTSIAKRAESRETGALYEPAWNERECDCGRWFTPAEPDQDQCRRCRTKD